ncbi:hypothetical protein [Dokdonella sp.]|uniref:hypothetical protein n=1 Tax=Dokdonella sp. TaxID=2291710 RepID=UPI0031C088A2|nr:hypothetical protein [Dokdonella sp.]
MHWLVWLGWPLALVALAVALWLWRQLRAERGRASELLCARMEVENRFDEMQTQLAAQAGWVDPHEAFQRIAEPLREGVAAVRGQLREVGAGVDDYRAHVQRFDAAVQYCLQPVELIFGADKKGLDELVSHVEGARRALFEARTALLAHPVHAATPDAGAARLAQLESRLRESADEPQHAD